MTTPADQIWAYLHNELSPEERSRFEQALKTNPVLQKELEDCRATHEELERSLPVLDSDNDELLEERLLAEWESEHPEYAETPARKPRRNLLYISLPLAAAAAATVMLLALPQKPIQWQRTSYGTAPQLRGQPATEPYYTRAELKQVNGELQVAVERHTKELTAPSASWKLRIHIQELASGALTLEISGHPRSAPDKTRVWDWTFQSMEDFRNNVPALGKQVAEDIAEQDTP